MLGKGEKRKLDDEEVESEGKGSAADPWSRVSYSLQRQTIFNISLMKLYNHRALTEPRLGKRVLINNMLRHIQEELKQEGEELKQEVSLRPMFFPPSPPPDDPMDEGFREASPTFATLSMMATPLSQALATPPPSPSPPPPSAPLDSCLTPASLLEEDDASFCPLPSSPAHSKGSSLFSSFSSALDDIEDLCPVSLTTETAAATTLSSTSLPLPLLPSAALRDSSEVPKTEGVASLTDSQSAMLETTTLGETRLMETLPPSSLDLSPAPSFLTDLALDDILFADIDTSMYDFDPCSSASGGGVSKLSPMVTADDLLKTLSSPYSGPTSLGQNQPFKMDLVELDHIMEVLVGS